MSISKGKRAKKSNKGKLALGIIFIIIILTVFIVLKFVMNNQDSNNVAPQEETKDNVISVEIEPEKPKVDEIVPVDDMPNKMGIYSVLGKIVIDKIGVQKYILDRTTNNSLDLAVTRFGSEPQINTVGNFCITGHNYKGIFKRLTELVAGDEFYLVGKDGRKVTYVIYDKFVINPADAEQENKAINQDTNGKRVVTLITCEPGAKKRLILKADEKI